MIFQIMAATAAAATVFSVVVSAIYWWVQRRAQNISRAYELFRYYYGAEHYVWVHGPTQSVITKWYNLPDKEKESYRAEVTSFWAGYDGNKGFLEKFSNPEERYGDHRMHHFRTTATRGGLTEAQALDCNLHFWSGLLELIELGMLDRSISIRLFKAPYDWRKKFYEELGNNVRNNLRLGDPEPDWLGNMDKLNLMFRDISR